MYITSSRNLEIKKIDVDSQFITILLSFIDKLENKELFDSDLYNQLLHYDLNSVEFNKMIETIRMFAFDDDDKEEINFPYEDWIDRITTTMIT